MSNHDYNLENQVGASFRQDLNNALQAIATQNSSNTEPLVTYPYQIWVNSATNIISQRNAANSAWIEQGSASAAFLGIVPVGKIDIFAGASAPAGFLLCDGSAVSRITYARLFAVISTTYGIGDGTNTFNLPNLKGRVPIGAGVSAASGTNRALGATGGADSHVLAVTEMPSHTHSLQHTTTPAAASGSSLNIPNNNPAGATLSTAGVGGSAAHNNLQPFIALNYIVKF